MSYTQALADCMNKLQFSTLHNVPQSKRSSLNYIQKKAKTNDFLCVYCHRHKDESRAWRFECESSANELTRYFDIVLTCDDDPTSSSDKWTVSTPSVPQQGETLHCGMYVIMFATQELEGYDIRVTNKDIRGLRADVCLAIMRQQMLDWAPYCEPTR